MEMESIFLFNIFMSVHSVVNFNIPKTISNYEITQMYYKFYLSGLKINIQLIAFNFN